ncbi:uncharacterized protein VTP21DRAFT_9912 [Calcarisporiella thermophila]|uniref:uncharacterized protein n=1 Tax=Calcarisporiella thermophila TaxID=911321 RepID=UPI003743FDD9
MADHEHNDTGIPSFSQRTMLEQLEANPFADLDNDRMVQSMSSAEPWTIHSETAPSPINEVEENSHIAYSTSPHASSADWSPEDRLTKSLANINLNESSRTDFSPPSSPVRRISAIYDTQSPIAEDESRQNFSEVSESAEVKNVIRPVLEREELRGSNESVRSVLLSEEASPAQDTPSKNKDSEYPLKVEAPTGAISFDITVGEPQKIGDPINAHIVYKVRTKTTSTKFKSQDITVQRRYRDFLWLYNQLVTDHPGIIVPPVPEKHAIGRFQDEFIESRRNALEKFLRKTIQHPHLYEDPNLKTFLESDTFNVDVKQKKTESESKGFMKSFGEAVSSATTFNKFVEMDEWFDTKKQQLETLESQLRVLLRAVEAVIKQRKDLGSATQDFGNSLVTLADVELNRPLASKLVNLGNLHKKLKGLHERQALQDVLTLANTIDEYIRIIGSIKLAQQARVKAYNTWQSADYELHRRQAAYEKVRSGQKTRVDKLAQLQTEITAAQHRVEVTEREFDRVTQLVREEITRFEKEKVEDFRVGVHLFLEAMVAHQREIIGLWEDYLEERSINDTKGNQGEQSTSNRNSLEQGS